MATKLQGIAEYLDGLGVKLPEPEAAEDFVFTWYFVFLFIFSSSDILFL